MSFAGSAALFLLRIGIKGEGGTLSVAWKSSVKSVERFQGDKAVASTMAVLFVVKCFSQRTTRPLLPLWLCCSGQLAVVRG
jgi:hypothetical protein